MRLTLIAPIALLVAASTAQGQNLLQNPGFDVNLAHWMEADPVVVEDTWDPMDVDDSPTSGSLRQENLNEDGVTTSGVSQCVPVDAGQAYMLGGSTYVPSGQPAEGRAEIIGGWHDEAGCTGGFIGGSFGFVGTSANFDDWFRFESEPIVAPDGAQALEVILGCRKRDAAGTFVAFWDEVFVLPEPTSELLRAVALLAVAVLARVSALLSADRPGSRCRAVGRRFRPGSWLARCR